MKTRALMLQALLLPLFGSLAFGQDAGVAAQANVTWKLPTTAFDGTALTSPVTKIQVWASTSSIPDNAPTPTLEIPSAATSWKYTTTVPNGSTLYFRVKACNIGGCSDLSAQTSKAVTVLVPGVPTGIAVTVTVTVTSP